MSKLMMAALMASALSACASYPNTIPDNAGPAPGPTDRDAWDKSSVFGRYPWEIRGMPVGIGHYHKDLGMLFPESGEAFQLAGFDVQGRDGKDVRLDYAPSDLGTGSQSRAFIHIWVVLTDRGAKKDFKAAVDRARKELTDASEAEPLAAPMGFPALARQEAFLGKVNRGGSETETFKQVGYFEQGAWTFTYDLTCPVVDLPAARPKIARFLTSLVTGGV